MIYISEKDYKIVLEIIKKTIPKCTVWAFGSRYKGTHKSYSDLDLVIICNEKILFKTLGKIQDAFEESELNFGVDVLDWNRISDEFRDIIKEGYEEIYISSDYQ
ncbi:MAG: nucleotidyltransferase family protein [Cetobacterium sp.]